MHIKFHSNRMLFTIQSINLFFIHNFRSQKPVCLLCTGVGGTEPVCLLCINVHKSPKVTAQEVQLYCNL